MLHDYVVSAECFLLLKFQPIVAIGPFGHWRMPLDVGGQEDIHEGVPSSLSEQKVFSP